MGEFHSSAMSAISAMAFSHSEIVLPMNVHNVASIIVSDQKNRSASCKSIVHSFVFHDFRWFQSHPVENKIRLYPFLVGGFNPSDKYESQSVRVIIWKNNPNL